MHISFSRCCCRWCRVARRSAELPPDVPRKRSSGKGLLKDETGKGRLFGNCYNNAKHLIKSFIALIRFIVLMRFSIFLESYMPTNRVNVPVMINLMLIFIYLFGGALAFTQVSFEVYQRHKIAKILF